MVDMTEREIEVAYQEWRLRYYAHNQLDNDLRPYLNLNATGSWLKRVRRGLCLSTRGVAGKMGTAQATYVHFERAEREGKISLANLRRCAAAMDCELVYVIRRHSAAAAGTVFAPGLAAVIGGGEESRFTGHSETATGVRNAR
jgi:transcriptional regulator with XRE-family HTH domain